MQDLCGQLNGHLIYGKSLNQHKYAMLGVIPVDLIPLIDISYGGLNDHFLAKWPPIKEWAPETTLRAKHSSC